MGGLFYRPDMVERGEKWECRAIDAIQTSASSNSAVLVTSKAGTQTGGLSQKLGAQKKLRPPDCTQRSEASNTGTEGATGGKESDDPVNRKCPGKVVGCSRACSQGRSAKRNEGLEQEWGRGGRF